MSWSLIVARYQEPIAWTASHRGIWNVHIVQKQLPESCGTPSVIEAMGDVPNEGREASSYLWWIVEHYDKIQPGDRIVFVQGNPYDHCPQFDGFLRSGVIFGPVLECDPNGWPIHSGLRASIATGRRLFGLSESYLIHFGAGAQFSVSGKAILAHSRETYGQAYEWCLEDPNAAHAMERLWMSVFDL
jgi:hypothetical protein